MFIKRRLTDEGKQEDGKIKYLGRESKQLSPTMTKKQPGVEKLDS